MCIKLLLNYDRKQKLILFLIIYWIVIMIIMSIPGYIIYIFEFWLN